MAMDEQEFAPRREGQWAPPVRSLHVDRHLGDADPTAVEGRRIAGPFQGFGKLWQKTYRVALEGVEVAPQQVIEVWKTEYGRFWPTTSRFCAPFRGLKPGEVALISDRAPAGLRLSTGVLVLYADEVSFTFLCPQGHPFAGMITFSAQRSEVGTVAQVRAIIRAQDPLVELTMPFYTHRQEDRIWRHVLTALAARFGVDDPQVTREVVCVDRKRQWERVGNVRHNAVLHALARGFRGRRSGLPAAR
jgi:hypothetical protein